MEREISFSDDGEFLVAHLYEEIDHHTAKPQREGIDEMLFRLCPSVLVLDFGRVRFMDSSGIGLIIGRAEIAKSLGCEVRIKSASERILRLIRLSGVEKIQNITII